MQQNVAVKLCECGCGGATAIAEKTDRSAGYVRGHPRRYLRGHQPKHGPLGPSSHNWNGGRYVHSTGYVLVLAPDHARADKKGYVLEHVMIAERAMGHALPLNAQIHHVNEIRSENRNTNLVICENLKYHKLLHKRERAYRATGSPLSIKCCYCKRWGLPTDPDIVRNSYHRSCQASHYQNKKAMREKIGPTFAH